MSSNKAILHYFNGRGKAEIVRLSMAAAGVQWEQKGITEKAQFQQLKDENKLLFGQLPLVEYDNKLLVQSGSTARYFARKADILGIDDDERVRIDVLFEGTRDFLSFFMSYGFNGWQEVVDNAKEKAIPKYLPIFNKVLEQNGSNGHLVGSKLSLADLGLIEVVLTIEDLVGADSLNPFPHVQKFAQTIKAVPSISAYLSSSQRFKKNDENYVNEVKRTLWA